jgi:CheY-like chemotaxis protein
MMDGMNGIQTAVQIGAMSPDCRIILISGIAGSGDLLDEAHAEGHKFEVLGKPFHPTELIDKLRG